MYIGDFAKYQTSVEKIKLNYSLFDNEESFSQDYQEINLDTYPFPQEYFLEFFNSNFESEEQSKNENDNHLLINHTKNSTISKKSKTKIFYFVKMRKKRGRKPSNNTKIYYPKSDENYHSKFREDNILQKIKVIFIKSTKDFINKKYWQFQGQKEIKSQPFLMKIKSKFAPKIKKEANIKFLEMTIKDLFSFGLSKRCFKHNEEYNKHQIDELYLKNEAKEIISIMNKTVEELLNNYVNGDYKNEGYFIENELNKEKEKMKNQGENDIYISDYINKFINIARNFGKIFRNKTSRRDKIKKLTS